MYRCQHCHEPILPNTHPFTLRLELFQAVEPSVEITQKEMDGDFETQMRELIELMEKMDEAEVLRQEKKVYFSRSFTLCPACRDRIARQLERLAPPAS